MIYLTDAIDHFNLLPIIFYNLTAKLEDPVDGLVYAENNRQQFLDDLIELCSIPTISSRAGSAADMEKGAQWVANRLKKAGCSRVEVLPSSAHPVVFGEALADLQDAPTMLVYGHYDVVAPGPLENWKSGPFSPVIVEIGRAHV